MKTFAHLPVIAVVILLTVSSCNQDSASHQYSARPSVIATAESTSSADSTDAPRSLAANESAKEEDKVAAINDPSRKVIKTADLRCRVADVFAATTRIERLASANGGGIADSRLENSTDDTRTLPYSTDSLRRVESYTTTAHLTLRIPVQRLDTVLADVAGGASFINSRNLHLDDVTLRYLGNKLKNEAMDANDAAGRARALARRSSEAIHSGDYTDERAETRIDRRIENMQLREDVAYATLTIDLYQPQRLAQSVVPDVDALMKPTIGQQTGMALAGGWHLLQAFLIGLLSIWPLLLLAAAGIFIYRRLRAPKASRARAGLV